MFFYVIYTIGCSNASIKFNHDEWIKANDDYSWDVRKKMAQDVIDTKMLVGMSKQDVIKILGEAKNYLNVESNKLHYTIEVDYGWDIDPVKIEYLIVSLNSNEQVISVYREIALDK